MFRFNNGTLDRKLWIENLLFRVCFFQNHAKVKHLF